MLDEIRLFIAALLFCLGVYLVWDLFTNGFNVVVLVAVFLSFAGAHYIKPNNKNKDDPSAWWDILDFLIDIPFKTAALLLRAVGRPFRGDIDGFDL